MSNAAKISSPSYSNGLDGKGDPTRRSPKLRQIDPLTGSLAPSIVDWATSNFSEDNEITDANVMALLCEASDAARNDLDETSANTWAAGYTFPPCYLASDKECLRAAQLDFVTMIRRRQTSLSSNRLNAIRMGSRVIIRRKDIDELFT